MVEEQRRLGRGLAALLGGADESSLGFADSSQRAAPLESLAPNPGNPRTDFDDVELDDLAESIRRRGILQPILVRRSPKHDHMYEIIAGERRWRAAQRAGLHDVPIVVIQATDKESLELAIIENVQRSDLDALDEAAGYNRLTQEYGYSHSEIASSIGKSRSHVANMVRLLKLPENAKAMLKSGELTAGHARALLAFDEPDKAAETVRQKGLTVRDIESLAKSDAQPSKQKMGMKQDVNVASIEKKLQDALGLKVTIRTRRKGGVITIPYTSIDQFELICSKLEKL